MRFLISVIDSATGLATPAEMAAIDAFNDALVENDQWVVAGGLTAPAEASVVDNRGGAGVESAGPLVSQAEYLSGFWLIEAPDREAARALAREASRACNRRVELRPLLG
jgi:hypothetical protein